jgi:O-6-methylguanine DNA methyltransferase
MRRKATLAEPPTVYYADSTPSPLGPVWAAISAEGLWSASYGIDEQEFREHILERGPAKMVYDETRLEEVLTQFKDFLEGGRKRFELAVDWRGMTPFQVAVRKAVMAVPYGTTASYGDIAARVGTPRAARAVGGVQASNPISFVIPCHRIITSDGGLGGYGGYGGLETKRWLLALEEANA